MAVAALGYKNCRPRFPLSSAGSQFPTHHNHNIFALIAQLTLTFLKALFNMVQIKYFVFIFAAAAAIAPAVGRPVPAGPLLKP